MASSPARSATLEQVTLGVPTAAVGGDIYRVGPTQAYATIDEALAAVVAARGTNAFCSAATVYVETNFCTNAIAITSNGLNPTADFPLVIRGANDLLPVVSGGITVQGMPYVRFENLVIVSSNENGATFLCDTAPGLSVEGCVMRIDVTFSNSPDIKVVGNTFDYRDGSNVMRYLSCSNALVRNNIVLNDGLTNRIEWSAYQPDSDYNCYYPSNSAVSIESNSVYGDPMLELSNNTYAITSASSFARAAGKAVSGFDTALLGRARDLYVPCIGASEYSLRAGSATTNIPSSFGVMWNAMIGDCLRVVPSGVTYGVGGRETNSTIDEAIAAILLERGTNTFTTPAIVYLRAGTYSNDIVVTNSGLRPTTENPLIIMAMPDNKVVLNCGLLVQQDNVHMQGLWLESPTDRQVVFDGVKGGAVASCIVRSTVTFTNCANASIIGNTFDYQNGTNHLDLTSSASTTLRNNIFLNDGATSGIQNPGTGMNSDYNCYWPSNSLIPTAEIHSVFADPQIEPTAYFPTNLVNAIVRSGTPMNGYTADLNGWYRHLTTPCMGAVEIMTVDESQVNSYGMLMERNVNGRRLRYGYDGVGRLKTLIDVENPAHNEVYTYDAFGNVAGMKIGTNTLYRRLVTDPRCAIGDYSTSKYVFEYKNADTVAEYSFSTSTGILQKRLYWLLKGIDRRVGFVSIT
ncbi:MAG: hypothetical protein WCP86_08795, partial [bacterium]